MAVLSPSAAYKILISSFGPQGWWPVTPTGASGPEYHPGSILPVSPNHALEVIVGAILTQNTAWTNVETAMRSLQQAKALDIKRILGLPNRRLEALIRSSGYFRQKAARLKVVMRHVQSRGGVRRWFCQGVDDLRGDLLSVTGIGPETADSILLYAAGKASFVVDAYTARIGGRIGWFSPALRSGKAADYELIKTFFSKHLPLDIRVFQEFHALLVALAKFYCRTEPLCAGCPLSHGCNYAQ